MSARGGQPGNKNALKHSAYSRQLQRAEPADVAAVLNATLADEIAALRLTAGRILEYAECSDDPAEAIKAYTLFGQACMQIGRLTVQQQAVSGRTDDNSSLILDAIKAAAKELRIK